MEQGTLKPPHEGLDGLLAATAVLLSPTFVYLQGSTIIHNQSSENVSLPSYVILVILSLAGILYGLIQKNKILIFTGILLFIGSFMTLVATVSYRPSGASNPGAFFSLR